ncbi:MAG: diacylglycerol kinase family lipid kinase [Chloroflexi bacterium]|nr:diacylglycerol kinase family lipid kinase [Chloroflexota bacterium]
MTVKVILNPYSNRWNAQRRWGEAATALRQAGVKFDLSVSERPGHLVDLAADAVRKGFSTIVVAGGDGSIGEVVNGAGRNWNEESPFPVTLGFMPLGTANDLVFNVGLPVDLTESAKIIAGGRVKPLDLCRCNQKYFVNNSACGLEPYVTTKHERIHWIKGILRYLVAAIWAILDKPEWQGEVRWDEGAYKGPLSLVSVGNGRRTGGFFMTPHADPFDGKLTLAFGYRGTRLGLFQALPRAFQEGRGSYIEMEGMHELHSTRISIRLDRPSPAHTDGELFDSWITDLEYRIFPSAIRILVP